MAMPSVVPSTHELGSRSRAFNDQPLVSGRSSESLGKFDKPTGVPGQEIVADDTVKVSSSTSALA
jgi:hypothetical protein